ncbi:hypothetical protein AGMMS50256_11660 [Betaproteobacteria bacterium]|nr:hypothetical protein AGMMS50256_11660 [Betaproteobacteria bacterium]
MRADIESRGSCGQRATGGMAGGLLDVAQSESLIIIHYNRRKVYIRDVLITAFPQTYASLIGVKHGHLD